MANPFFHFKQFTIYHDRCAMKVTTDGCLFGAWCAAELQKEIQKMDQVLDIGAGTGLLSLMVAQKNSVKIDAVEIDENAAAQASENVAASPWKEQLQLIQGDVLEIPFANTYDCIISNPPFYENELQSENASKNIAHHSHQLKLEELFSYIEKHLGNQGTFFLLLPYKRKEEVQKMLQQKNLFIAKEVFVRQSVKHQPFRMMLRGSKQANTEKQTEELAIWDANNQYTEAFTQLLKDYYLYL